MVMVISMILIHLIPLNLKQKQQVKQANNDTKNIEIMVPLKYVSNFWRSIEISLINCEINLDLNWPKKFVIVSATVANQEATFLITDTKLYFPIEALSTQDDAKLLEQIKSAFKRTFNWNKYVSKNTK